MPNLTPPKIVARIAADPNAAELVRMDNGELWLRDPTTRAMLRKLDADEAAKIASDPRTVHFRI